MGFFDSLKKKAPKGKKFVDNDIRKFIRLHFDEIAELRRLNYSWGQIAEAVQEKICLKADNLKIALTGSFNKEKKERTINT